MSNTVDPWIGKLLSDRYRIHAALGRGGMGTVYAATQEALNREVAVKMVRTDLGGNPEAVERFKREAQVIARLNHPNIVTVHDFGSTPNGELYIVMERIAGASLKDVARHRGGPLPWNELFGVMTDVAAALVAAHEKGIIHRDLKPENIMVETGGLAKVLDFGVAKLADPMLAEGQQALTGTGMIMGTPGYMAPEVVMGKVLDDPRSDLYSLGLLWLEMLLGRPVFDGPTPSAILIQQINEGPPAIESILPDHGMPAEVKEILEDLLQRRPDDRPPSAQVVYNRLNALRAKIETGLVAVVSGNPTDTIDDTNPSSLKILTIPASVSSVFTNVMNTPLPPNGGTLSYGADVASPNAASSSVQPAPHVTMIPTSSSPQTPVGQGTAWPANVAPQPASSKMLLAAALGGAFILAIGVGAFFLGQTSGDTTPMPLVTATSATDLEVEKARAEAAIASAELARHKAEAALAKEKAALEVEAAPKAKARKRRGRSATKVATKAAAKPDDTKVETPPKDTGPGRLTSALIKTGISQSLGKAAKCRNTNIKRRAAGPGLLVDHCPSYKTIESLQSLKLKVTPSGDVIGARFAAGNAKSDIAHCVLESVQHWKFPPFEGGEPIEISQRVEFEPCVPINNVCVF